MFFSHRYDFCVNKTFVRKIELDLLIVCPFPLTSSGLEKIDLGPAEAEKESSLRARVCAKLDVTKIYKNELITNLSSKIYYNNIS